MKYTGQVSKQTHCTYANGFLFQTKSVEYKEWSNQKQHVHPVRGAGNADRKEAVLHLKCLLECQDIVL